MAVSTSLAYWADSVCDSRFAASWNTMAKVIGEEAGKASQVHGALKNGHMKSCS